MPTYSFKKCKLVCSIYQIAFYTVFFFELETMKKGLYWPSVSLVPYGTMEEQLCYPDIEKQDLTHASGNEG